MKKNDDNVVILDARNTYESRIGAFEGAIKPDIGHFRDLPEFIKNNPDLFQNKDVLMYCTGGIRCERASAYLKEQDIANNVYQLSGGIHRYAEQYDDGFFRGKNYVFDKRISQRITNDVLTTCDTCEASCDMYTNCINALCSKHCILCANCLHAYSNTCSQACFDLIQSGDTQYRTEVRAAE
jgi:predicted sulfurtransferase